MQQKESNHDLKHLKHEVERHLAWGSSPSWHSSMYQELSDKVFQATRVMLSVTTLKRFFGAIEHKGSPGITTLDALSQFVGKENWRAFKLSKKRHFVASRPLRKSAYVSIGFVLAILIIFLVGSKRPGIMVNSSAFSFSSHALSDEFPNSVVFDFELPQDLKTDSLYVQQSWDPTKTVHIEKTQKQATAIYFFPGYFRAKLMVHGKAALEHDLFLKSQGWLGTIEYEPVPKYFEPEKPGNSRLSSPVEIAREVVQSDAPLTSVFHYVDDLGEVSGDHFSFAATFQNKFDDRWAVCQAMRIYFLGTKGAMIIPFSKTGCASDNNLMLNDLYLGGKKHDLSPLSADFANPVDIHIVVVNKQVKIALNQQVAYENTYTQTLGRLVGLRFKFKGLGEVSNIELWDRNSQSIKLP